jgi:hypothetical protein
MYARLAGSVDFVINFGFAETTKSSQICPSVGSNTNAKRFMLEIMHCYTLLVTGRGID